MKTLNISTPLHANYVTLVDDDDWEWLSQWKWSVCKGARNTYASRGLVVNGKQTTIRMHVQILGRGDGSIDHIDRNGLNNQRCNLRRCSRTENTWNASKHQQATSRFKGVVRVADDRWTAYIKENNHRVNLGIYQTEELAAAAYNLAARKKRGIFAVMNDVEWRGAGDIDANRLKRGVMQRSIAISERLFSFEE